MREDKLLMTGNEAIGEAAIQAGVDAYFGYPITPQNELTAYMSRRMLEEGRVFIQSESELAAINMVLGAAVSGKRAMTSSSSPGISLKQEGISYLAGMELPAVVANIVRGGPGLGNIAPAQSDYWQGTRGGGHGDYRTICLGPSTVQECVDLVYLAFDLADQYRNPAVILADGRLGQMMEPVSFDHLPPPSPPDKPWALTGASGREQQSIKSLFLDPDVLEALNLRLAEKYDEIERNEKRWETVLMDDAEICIVAYGTSARVSKETIRRARDEGIRVGLIRPISLWPYPYEPVREAAETVRFFLVPEMSLGQMIEDVRLAVEGRCPVYHTGRVGGNVSTSTEILDALHDCCEKV
ncbi:MAG: 3-methyl-2-oxobutanoate dehydrogenase subunit VorB [Planctomycetota bacterium]